MNKLVCNSSAAGYDLSLDGVVQLVACPVHSRGSHVGQGCQCEAGFLGNITPTSTPPFFSGLCTAATSPSAVGVWYVYNTSLAPQPSCYDQRAMGSVVAPSCCPAGATESAQDGFETRAVCALDAAVALSNASAAYYSWRCTHGYAVCQEQCSTATCDAKNCPLR